MKKQYVLIFGEKAEKEFLNSVDWYNNKLIGLGEEFIAQIRLTIIKIQNNPKLFQKKKFNLREAQISIFPYLIIYEVKEKVGEIHILSIFHTHRNPSAKFNK